GLISLKHAKCPVVYLAPPASDSSTLSLHDALPISICGPFARTPDLQHWRYPGRDFSFAQDRNYGIRRGGAGRRDGGQFSFAGVRSEEHTSELQSLAYLVCRLLLEKKNTYRRCF